MSVVQRRPNKVLPHTAAITHRLLGQFKWEMFEHPFYSPELAPSDYHSFLCLKSFLAG